MNNSNISQKIPITACLGAILSLLAHFMVRPVKAYTPEAEAVLEALQESMATGLVGESEYFAFLSQLEEGGGCENWGLNPPSLKEAVFTELLEACPDLKWPGSKSPSTPTRWSAVQSVQPRIPNTPLPYLQGETRTPYGGFTFSWRDLSLFDRRAEIKREGFKLHAGHIHSALSATRLDFVAGSRFYAGWTGQSGFSGPLASPKATLDGLSLSYQGSDWQAQAAGAWNRIQNQGSGTVAESGLDRKDALLYLFGMARKNMVLQIAHQRFEPAAGRPVSVSICGGSLMGSHGLWRLGLAGSVWKGNEEGKNTGAHSFEPGVYGELAIGKSENSQLEISQASPSWSNPLQAPRGYRQDTLDGQWFQPGRGEGKLHGHTQIPVYVGGFYRLDLKAGGDVTWVLGTTGLLAAESRLAVVQGLGNWSYACGTGAVFKRSHQGQTPPSEEETGGGLGHIVLWHRSIWKARISLIQQKPGYRGPYLEPLTVSLERGNRHRQIRKLRAEIFTGDVKNPAVNLRFGLKQEWNMGGGLVLKQGIRMPWSKDEGWKKDLGYQLGLEASL